MLERKLVGREVKLEDWTDEELTPQIIREKLLGLEIKYPNPTIRFSGYEYPIVTVSYFELETDYEYNRRIARLKNDEIIEASLKSAKAKLTADEIEALKRFRSSW